MKRLLFIGVMQCVILGLFGRVRLGDWTISVALSGYVSEETGKAPNAYLWMPDSCGRIRFVVLAQQNMTEEALLRNSRFRANLQELGGAVIWVAPWFSQDWSPATGCQQTFEKMMKDLAEQSGHKELEGIPVVPFGHSAQATFPWNFAAWNNDRTLAVVSFHGDAPRTNLCGYGRENLEWGRNRNIDGIPGLMIEGEYEWWQARVRPAKAFQMMYPDACVSFFCDAGSGHFDLSEATVDYISLFIRKACEQRLQAEGILRRLSPSEGWRFGAPSGGEQEGNTITAFPTTPPAAWTAYPDDPHDAFWYFDEEMARLTMSRYMETAYKKPQQVGLRYQGRSISYDSRQQGGMFLDLSHLAIGDRFTLEAVGDQDTARCHVDYICGPVRKLTDKVFEIIPYDCGADNPKRSHTAWLVAVAEGDRIYKRAVQPVQIKLR